MTNRAYNRAQKEAMKGAFRTLWRRKSYTARWSNGGGVTLDEVRAPTLAELLKEVGRKVDNLEWHARAGFRIEMEEKS